MIDIPHFRVLYFSEAHKPMTTDSDTAEAEAILAALDAMKEKG
jgi:ribonuclease HI